MARHALLIGAQVGRLRGVHEDVRRMTEALKLRGFEVDPRTHGDASRAGIVEGLRRLARRLSAGDVGLIYYSGHGGQLPIYHLTQRTMGREAPRDAQFLVPTDFDDPGRADFRGITSWELSRYLADLTAQTERVIAIFDCCHAARIVRHDTDDAPTTRGLPYPSAAGMAAHLLELEARGMLADLDPLGNPHAVRLFATADTSYSWEGDFAGVRCGVMTEALVRYLTRIGDRPVSWHALTTVIRERVQQQRADQRPEVSGPAWRALFAADDDARVARCVGVAVRGARAVVRAGSVAGACRGDVYDVLRIEAPLEEAAPPIATLTLDDVGPFESTAALTDPAPLASADGVIAVPRRQALPPFAVRCIGGGELRADLAAQPWLRVESANATAAITVTLGDGRWSISDATGVLAEGPSGAYEIGAPRSATDRLFATLANLAAAHALRALEAQRADVELDVAVKRTRDGSAIADRTVAIGDALEIAIENRSPHALFAHVFAIEPHGAIGRLTADASLGIEVQPGSSHVVGGSSFGRRGIAVRWPAQLPPAAARAIDLVVVATAAPTDLQFVERRAPAPRTGPVRAAFGSRAFGAPRVLSPVADAPTGYAVAHCRYLIAPPA